MTEVKMTRKTQEEMITQLIFDISLLRVQLGNLHDRFNNHEHGFSEVSQWVGNAVHTSKPIMVEEKPE